MTTYKYTNQQKASLAWIDDSFNRVYALLLRGQLEKARVIISQLLVSEVLNSNDRIDCIYLKSVILSHQYSYTGDKEGLNEAQALLHETIGKFGEQAPPKKVLRYQLELAHVYLKGLHFFKAEQLLNTIISDCSIYHQEYKTRAYTLLSKLNIEQNNYTKALEYNSIALHAAEKINDPILLIDVYNILGNLYLKKRRQSEAQLYLNRAFSLAKQKNYYEAKVIAQKLIAVSFAKNSQYKEAMENFLEALEASKKIGHRSNIAHCLINIGTIHAHLLNYPEALNRYSTAIAIYHGILDERSKVILLNNIGNTHYAIEKYDTAITYFSKVLIVAKNIEYAEMEAHAYAQLSKVYIAKQQFGSAISFANKSAQLYNELEQSSKEKHGNLMNLAQIAFYQKQYSQARNYALLCIEKAKLYKDDYYLIKSSKLIANIYETQGKYKKAAEYYKLYSSFQSEWFKIQKLRHTLDAEIRYSINEKEKDIEILRKENEYNSILIEQNKQMELQNKQLRSVNEELKQFAYVVSHDLKEPMRMIVSYTQLIEKHHKDKLSGDTGIFFGYVKDGATRMNKLLEDLLEYATVGRNKEQLVLNDLNEIIATIIVSNLHVKIQENKAVILFNHLPTIMAEQSLLVQLFQNLVSNAIKFKGDRIPVITITSEEDNERYLFGVSDNGIGIAKEYQERIFKMFQRLHGRSEYEGSGIGLSICQKIVYRLGGKIWIESEVGKGTTFFFTILKQ